MKSPRSDYSRYSIAFGRHRLLRWAALTAHTVDGRRVRPAKILVWAEASDFLLAHRHGVDGCAKIARRNHTVRLNLHAAVFADQDNCKG